jgi:hypothetical protein
VSDTGLLAVLIGGCIGLVLAVPAVWGIFKWVEYRDMTRVDREMWKLREMDRKR